MLHVVKVRIYPTEEQQQFLRGQFGAVHYCYNKAVAIKKHRYKVHRNSARKPASSDAGGIAALLSQFS